jgi:tetratricopeptide (TPR) repeat protein
LAYFLLITVLLSPLGAQAQNVNARNNYKVGRTYFEKGEYDKAIENFEKAIKDDSTFADAHYLLGLSYMAQKKYDKAKEKLEYVIRLDSSFLGAYQNLGNVFLEQKKYKECKENFEKMKSIPRAAPEAFFCLGVLAYAQQDLKEAEKQWRETLRLDAKNARARYNLGVLHEAEERKKEALADYAAAAALNPENPRYVVSQASVYLELGQKNEAKNCLDKTKKLSEKRHDIGFLAEALTQFSLEQYDKVVVACNAALDRNPDLTTALLLKARALEHLKKNEEARQAYQAAADSDPNIKEAKTALERLKPSATPTPSPTPTSTATPTPQPSATPKAVKP